MFVILIRAPTKRPSQSRGAVAGVVHLDEPVFHSAAERLVAAFVSNFDDRVRTDVIES